MAKNTEKSEELKLEIMTLIGRFGWIRTEEIAEIVWSDRDETNAYKYAHAFLKKLAEQKLIYIWKLPKKGGTVGMLTMDGVNLLKKNKIFVKKVNLENENWKAPITWKHHVMVHGIFVRLIKEGFIEEKKPIYLSDRECKRAKKESTNEVLSYVGETKIPDLIVKTRFGVLAIEVERAAKTGAKSQGPLVDNLIKTNAKQSPYTYDGLEPECVAIAYDENQEIPVRRYEKTGVGDEKILVSDVARGIDHGKNIAAAIEKRADFFGVKKLRFMAFVLNVKNDKVKSISRFFDKNFECNRAKYLYEQALSEKNIDDSL